MPRRVCIAMKPGHIGGPSSFVRKLAAGLEQRGVAVTYSLADRPYDAVLVVNATRELDALWRCKREGIPIIQRLGGLNWAHHFLPVGMRGFVLAEIRNLMMRLVRARLASAIVYQSKFVEEWWNCKYGYARVPTLVIHNGVDLEQFKPEGPRYDSPHSLCLITVEGSLGVDPWLIPIRVAQQLIAQGMDIELIMCGLPRFGVEKTIAQYPFVNMKGIVPNRDLPPLYRGTTVCISTDVIAACPNSVIEALACGTPVVGFRAGALPEMLGAQSDWCVEYGGDPWRMEPPQGIEQLAVTVLKVVEAQEKARTAARTLAEERYSLEQMVDAYLDIFFV